MVAPTPNQKKVKTGMLFGVLRKKYGTAFVESILIELNSILLKKGVCDIETVELDERVAREAFVKCTLIAD